MINKNAIFEIISHHCELPNIPVILKKNFESSIVKGSLISKVFCPFGRYLKNRMCQINNLNI